jgi:hypothetical protein
MKLNEPTSNNWFHRTQTASGACAGRGVLRLSMFALIEIAILTAPFIIPVELRASIAFA